VYEVPSIILRYGVLAGLALTFVGIIVNQVLHINTIIMLGLLTIVLTPLVSLFTISVLLLLRKDIYGFILSQLAIIIILASIITSLYE